MAEKNLNIIIVEDDEDDYEILSHALKKCNLPHEETWFRDGGEVIDYLKIIENGGLQKYHRTVFFLDINIPKFDGLELLGLIKRHPATKGAYVFMLTGSTQQSDMDTSKELGSDFYMEKPFGKEQLIQFDKLLHSKLSSLI